MNSDTYIGPPLVLVVQFEKNVVLVGEVSVLSCFPKHKLPPEHVNGSRKQTKCINSSIQFRVLNIFIIQSYCISNSKFISRPNIFFKTELQNK